MNNTPQPKPEIVDRILKWSPILGALVLICVCAYLVLFEGFRLSNEQEIFGFNFFKPSATPTESSTPIGANSSTPQPLAEMTPTINAALNSGKQQKICEAEAFAPGTYSTSSPVFQRRDGYTSGWITMDPADMRLPSGSVEILKYRTVIIVDDTREVFLENLAMKDGHAQVSGCWFRSDLTSDVQNEAESKFHTMQAANPNDPISWRVLSPQGLDTVSETNSDQATVVRKEHTGVGNMIAYTGYLPENHIIVGAGTQFDSVQVCPLFVLNGPRDYSFRLTNGLWEQYILASEDQKQTIIQSYYEILSNYDCPTEKVQFVEVE